MIKNPYVNAVAAAVYIVLIVNVVNFVSQRQPEGNLLMPMLALSLLTLSAAIMGYLFLGQPIQSYLDGKKKEALAFFFQTVGTFAVITVLFLVAVASGLGF